MMSTNETNQAQVNQHLGPRDILPKVAINDCIMTILPELKKHHCAILRAGTRGTILLQTCRCPRLVGSGTGQPNVYHAFLFHNDNKRVHPLSKLPSITQEPTGTKNQQKTIINNPESTISQSTIINKLLAKSKSLAGPNASSCGYSMLLHWHMERLDATATPMSKAPRC